MSGPDGAGRAMLEQKARGKGNRLRTSTEGISS